MEMEEVYKVLLQFHTAEELRFSSNFVHWIVGGVFATVVVISIAQTFGYLKHKTWHYFPPILILTTSIALLLYLSLHHGFGEIGRVWQLALIDPQQRQHVFMAILLIVLSITELFWRTKQRGTLWQVVWPCVIAVIGVMFLWHPQHGTKEAIVWSRAFHTYLGIVLMLTGLLKTIDVVWVKKARWITLLWTTMLLIASLMLLSYREPEGSYTIEAMKHQVGIMTSFVGPNLILDKLLVAVFGIGAVAFTYWFFLMKRDEAIVVTDQVDIIVDGGYQPEVISVPKGKTTKLNFVRRDPSSCLEEVVLGDFKIRKFLPLNQKVTVEVTPQKEGEYQFACGMNMFHGKILVN